MTHDWKVLYYALTTLIVVIIGVAAFFTFKLERGRRRAEREYAVARPQVKFSEIGSVRRLSLLPLCEWHTSSSRYETDDGVSYLIRADGTAILMDLSRNAKKQHPSPLLANMQALGVNPGSIDMIFFSHMHPDHTGAGWEARPKTFRVSEGPVALPPVPAYAPGAISPSHWNPLPTVDVIAGPRILAPGIAAIGPIPQELFLVGHVDEDALAIHLEGKGIVLFVGCGHQGVSRILERAQALFDIPIYGLVGGLHLPAAGGLRGLRLLVLGSHRFPLPGDAKRRVTEAIARLKAAKIGIVGLSPHDSTGWTIAQFRNAFGDRYREVAVGSELVF